MIEIKNSLASKHLKLERNKAFSGGIMLYFIKNKGTIWRSRIQSVHEALDTATERDCEAYTFHIIIYGTIHETQK